VGCADRDRHDLTYTLLHNIWGSFAFPFYLEFLKYSKEEVAFASGFRDFHDHLRHQPGWLSVRPSGAHAHDPDRGDPADSGNFVYADLAEGSPGIDAVGGAIGLRPCLPCSALTSVWCACCWRSASNISTGIAGAAFVAYMSGIVSKSYTAVQYALLSSLTFLVGSLGRGIAGEAFDTYGYAVVSAGPRRAGSRFLCTVGMGEG
jgi:PAT family beta-lactamase induction signal transducer AmpG